MDALPFPVEALLASAVPVCYLGGLGGNVLLPSREQRIRLSTGLERYLFVSSPLPLGLFRLTYRARACLASDTRA